MNSPEPHWKDKFLVVGLDIGTTHSGYAWSFLADYRSDSAKIQTKTWKGEGRLTTGKTPTCLLLKSDKSFCKFGYDAMKKYSELVDGGNYKAWHYFEKFKMTLYDEKHISLNSKVLDSEGRKFPAVDIFAETIRYLKNNFLEIIQATERKIPDTDIFYVITTPAIWSEKAKSFMRKAGEKAGILPDHLRIALEPECAAVYIQSILKCPQYSAEQRPDASLCITRSPGLLSSPVEFRSGMTYLVADMGGGTIDITLHSITEDGKLQELAIPSGGSWGSDTINMKVVDLIISLVGAPVYDEFRQDHPEEYIEWLSEVEHKKCKWDGESSVNIAIPAPLLEMHKHQSKEDLSMSVKQSPYSHGTSVKYNKLKLQKDMFENKCFKFVIQETVNYIKATISRIDRRVDMILVVGGFADCELLRKRINENLSDAVDAIIYPTCEAVLAVLKGSVLFGRDPLIIDSRICRYTYGLDWNEEFDHKKHPVSKRECTDAGVYCKDIFRKLIQKGQLVDSSSFQTIEAYPRYKTQERIDFPFYRSEAKASPKFVDGEGCFHMGTLSVELPPSDKMNLDACIKMKLMFGLTELTAEATDSTNRKYFARFNMLET